MKRKTSFPFAFPSLIRTFASEMKLFRVLLLLLTLAACTNEADRQYYAGLMAEADSLNRHYISFTTDSVMKDAVSFYDRHGSANERMRAHYLLGCVYRDLGEAPLIHNS